MEFVESSVEGVVRVLSLRVCEIYNAHWVLGWFQFAVTCKLLQ